jgi:hypothetical protein
MFWLQYLVCRLPLVAGSLVGDVVEGLRTFKAALTREPAAQE